MPQGDLESPLSGHVPDLVPRIGGMMGVHDGIGKGVNHPDVLLDFS